jgi:predicted negative regulator of RcsB-dependent stress response
MVRHPTARRVHRPAEASDDAFVAGVLESTVWAKRHGRTLIVGGVLLALLLLGFLFYRSQAAATRERSAMELERVRATLLTGNTTLAAQELQAFVNQYGGTPAGREARLLLGQALFDEGQPQQAIEAVERLARDPDEPLGAAAAFLAGAAHEALGAPQQAETLYLRVADDARFDFQRLEALDKAARLRITAGNPAGAAELYQRAIDMIPPERAADRSLYRMRQAEAQAMAQTGTAGN